MSFCQVKIEIVDVIVWCSRGRYENEFWGRCELIGGRFLLIKLRLQ